VSDTPPAVQVAGFDLRDAQQSTTIQPALRHTGAARARVRRRSRDAEKLMRDKPWVRVIGARTFVAVAEFHA
jgi:hypothetical protein